MPKLDTAYLGTILNEEQRTLLRFAAYLNLPVVIDGPKTLRQYAELIKYLRDIGVNALQPEDLEEPTIQDNSAYIVLTLKPRD